MDKFGIWEINRPTATREIMGLSPCSWRNQQRETYSKSSAQSIMVDHDIGGGDVDLAEALLISSKRLHGVVKTNELSKDVDTLLPPSHLETVSGSSAAETSSQSQEALLLAAAAELATSEAATPWFDAFASLGHLREHFGLPISEPPHVHIDISDEEDVSAILLSNCDNIPNFLSCGGNVSSGESENCSSLHNGGDQWSDHHHCSNVDEVVSRGPPNPDATTRLMASKSGNDLKRKERDQIDECAGGDQGSLYRDALQSDSSATGGGGFRIFFENAQSKYWKKPRSDKCQQRASSIDFRLESGYEPDAEALAQVKEMIYRAAAMRPVSLGGVEAVKPKRKNVRISSDPQTVAARHRRERISERLRVLQRLVPGGSKMDTASMLDEAANYLKFLKSQVSALETLGGQGIGSMAAAASSSPSLPLSSVPFSHALIPMQTQTQTLEQTHHQTGALHPLQF